MLFNCFKQKWQSLTDDQKAIIICYTIGAIIAALFIFIIVDKAFGKDFGVQGHRWEIAETDILEYIEKKLVAVDIEKLTEEMIKKTTERVEEPEPVSGIVDVIFGKATKYYYDPSYIVPEDIYDHKGNLIYEAGYKVNPLEQVPLRERLIFINGKNEKQLEYAMRKRGEYGGMAKIILISGRPLDIQRKNKVWIYFDQQGVLTAKFGIKGVPAIVEQAGLKLRIIEVDEEEWGK
jgi:conjugal transfer pilus assembly protein TraW